MPNRSCAVNMKPNPGIQEAGAPAREVALAPAARHLPVLGSLGLRDPQARRVTYLRISLTDRCNYRCTYCMPPQGVELVPKPHLLTFEEIERLARVFLQLGVRRLRLTGGEPTIRKDLLDLVSRLAALPGLQDLSLSTNGEALGELAEPLRRAGLQRLNVSLDSLDPERFWRITRRGRLAEVLAGLDAAVAAGFTAIKLNAVAMRGFNDDELGALCRFAWARRMIPRFIEVMPMAAGELFVPGELLPAVEMRARIEAEFPGCALVPASGSAPGGGPARYYRLEGAGAPEGAEVGLITPMTEHFCDTCNRVRLSSVGTLHPCLAHDDGTDLRTPLRDGASDDTLRDLVKDALSGKRDGHWFGLAGEGGPKRAMVSIGG